MSGAFFRLLADLGSKPEQSLFMHLRDESLLRRNKLRQIALTDGMSNTAESVKAADVAALTKG